MPLTPPSELHVRREALAFSTSQVRLVAVTMWFIVCGASWLAWRAKLPVPATLLLAMGVVNALWRLRVLQVMGDPFTLEAEALSRIERSMVLNMAFSGLMWSYATLSIYPHLDVAGGVVYVAMQFTAVTFTAFFMSTISHGFVVMVLPMMAVMFGVNVLRSDPEAWLLAALVAAFTLVMTRASQRFRDIALLAFRHGHEMRVANTELRRAMADAEVAARAKTRFLATMSHELRTPMNGLLGALDLLSRAPLAGPECKLVEVARSSGEGLMAVVNDVLDYAKIDADQIALATAPMSPRALADSVVGLFTASALAKGLVLRVEVEAGVPNWVLGDSQRLRQVLLNIVGNAMKFTREGQVLLRVRRLGGGLRFEVQDSGIGIAPEAQRHLFEPFRQLDEGSSREHGGSGLGLAISQRLVQAMGGNITVDSAAGRGACFGFTLALPPTAAPAAAAQPPRSPAPGLCGRVLFAEDNPVNRTITSQMLMLLGLEVAEADDGEQALARLHAERFDLVLLDGQMPRKDGYQTAREWRAHEAATGRGRLPLLAITANVLAEDRQRALAAGMDEVLGKPFTFEQLRVALARWLPVAA